MGHESKIAHISFLIYFISRPYRNSNLVEYFILENDEKKPLAFLIVQSLFHVAV